MIDILLSGLAEVLGVALETIVDFVMPIFSFDFTLFNTSFPFAKTAYTIFQAIGLGIVFLLASVQIIPFFFGSSRNKTTPIRAAVFAIMAVFGIYYGNYIMSAIMDIAQMPYNALLSADIGYGSLANVISGEPIASLLYDTFIDTSVLLFIILLILIGIAFVKLLLEGVERYVVLFTLVYLTPLAASSLASETTSGIFKRFFTMFLSQCILLILNIWSLQMITSLFANMIMAENPAITLLVGYAFLRVASRLDSYLNSLGLNAAITGAGLGAELMSAGMAVLATGKTGKSGSGENAILGFSRNVSNTLGKINPVTGVAKATRNFIGGVAKTTGEAFEAQRDAVRANGGTADGIGMSAFKDTWKQQIHPNVHAAFMKTQDQNLYARKYGQWKAGKSEKDTSVDQSVEKMFAEGSLTNQEMQDLATTSFMANQAFSGVPEGGEVNDTAIVAAAVQGMGLPNVMPEVNDAIQAGYGNTDAEFMDYRLNENGIQMAYTANGREHTWDIRSAAQMANLSAQEQSGYTKFKNDGQVYYAKHSNRNDRIGTMFADMQKTNSSTTLTSENKNQFVDLMNSTKWQGVSPKTQQEITTAVQGGAGHTSGGMDSRRFWIETEKGYGISVISKEGISENKEVQFNQQGKAIYDRATLEDRGYTYNNINGHEYWVKESTKRADDYDPDNPTPLFDET